MHFTDPATSGDLISWAQRVGALGGTTLMVIATVAWFRRWIVTAGELRDAKAAHAAERADLYLMLGAKDALIAKKDDQLAAVQKALVDETVPALVKATVVMDRQQAALDARRTR